MKDFIPIAWLSVFLTSLWLIGVTFYGASQDQEKVKKVDTIIRIKLSLDSLYWDTANRDRHATTVDSLLTELNP